MTKKLNILATEWKPEFKEEADLVLTPLQKTENRGFTLDTDVSPQAQSSVKNVTFTFYAHTFTAAVKQGIPITIVIDRNCTILNVYCHVETAPGAGKTTTIDVNKGGTTLFTTQSDRPSITGTDKTANGVPDITALVTNDQLTMDVDVNDGVAVKLSVYVRCIA